MREHLPALFGFLSKLTGCAADAEDILQDLLIKLYPRLDELHELEELRPWLMKVAYRQFIDHSRSQKRNPVSAFNSAELDDVPEQSDSDTPEKSFSHGRAAVEVAAALAELDAERRALVVMHLIDGYSLEEVSGVLELPLGTVKSRLHRVKAQLKERLVLEPFSGNQRVSAEGKTDAM